MSINLTSTNCYSNSADRKPQNRSLSRVAITSFRPHREAYNGCIGELVSIPAQESLLVKIDNTHITFFRDELTPLNFSVENYQMKAND